LLFWCPPEYCLQRWRDLKPWLKKVSRIVASWNKEQAHQIARTLTHSPGPNIIWSWWDCSAFSLKWRQKGMDLIRMPKRRCDCLVKKMHVKMIDCSKKEENKGTTRSSPVAVLEDHLELV
jgi:hypothetical protein